MDKINLSDERGRRKSYFETNSLRRVTAGTSIFSEYLI